MFCPKCGASNQGDARFCSGCGAPLPSLGAEGRDTRWNAPAKQEKPHPTGRVHEDPGEPVNSHLVAAILVAIFCCQPLGIVAIVFSAMAMGKNTDEDYAQAKRYADISYKCILWGIVLWFAVVLLWFVLILAGFAPLALQSELPLDQLPPGFPKP